MAAIEVDGLTKCYGRGAKRFTALDELRLQVEDGQIYGLLGPNGAGKTTLVKLLLGLRWPSGGQARILGAPAGTPGVRRQVGYLPEDHRLPLYLTGLQSLTVYGLLQGLSGDQVRARAMPLLERLDLKDWARTKVRKYSKGMKQRLGLAQALLHEPRVLFLDEPTDGVDPVGRKIIRDMIEEIHRKGTTVFINSHLLMEVEMICDRIAILNRGKKVREGTIEELIPKTNDFVFRLAPHSADVDLLLRGIAAVEKDGKDEGGYLLALDREEDLDAAIDRLRGAGVGIREIVRRRQTLEEFFLETIEGGTKA
ncbi:MAG: ABC transporter ATP-binding protein [Planctomycetes bacterium]|nr:ABC transporter ATP-binding protein [Planctomycetota bacterium]